MEILWRGALVVGVTIFGYLAKGTFENTRLQLETQASMMQTQQQALSELRAFTEKQGAVLEYLVPRVDRIEQRINGHQTDLRLHHIPDDDG